ncbi:Sec-independent protein translocase protein TatB [Amphritea sp. HPY]|uniref:Sec-independent protein translocase protein TatB n=1 Tax=Amphritea sp. HPY TaxID=3421652 RepID=UPI003D7C8058
MFDIGFAELLIIGVVGLVVLGPDKMPVAARTVGLWVGKARRTISGIQSEINEELRLDEMKRQVAIQKEDLDKELNEMREPFSGTLDSNSPVANSAAKPVNDSNDSAVAGGSQESKPKADD